MVPKLELRRTQRPPSLAQLGQAFGRLRARGAGPLWAWARALLGFYEAGRIRARNPLTMRQLGDGVGIAARGRPFGVPWVSRALAAARAWPKAPSTDEERRGFSDAFYGNARKTLERDDPHIALRRVLKRLRRAAADAVGLGCFVADVEAFIHAALIGNPEGADDERAFSFLRPRERSRINENYHVDVNDHDHDHDHDNDVDDEPGGRTPARRVSCARAGVSAA